MRATRRTRGRVRNSERRRKGEKRFRLRGLRWKKSLPKTNYYHPDLRGKATGTKIRFLYRNSYITEFRYIIIETERVYTDAIIRGRHEITLYTQLYTATLSPPYSMQPGLQLGRTAEHVRGSPIYKYIHIYTYMCIHTIPVKDF